METSKLMKEIKKMTNDGNPVLCAGVGLQILESIGVDVSGGLKVADIECMLEQRMGDLMY